MVVEVLEMPEARHRAAGRDACRRCAVRREVERKGGGERACTQEARDAAAARDIGLQTVDAAVGDEIAEVGRDVRILTGRDLEPGGCAVAQQAQSFEVCRADRFLVPANAPYARDPLPPRERPSTPPAPV